MAYMKKVLALLLAASALLAPAAHATTIGFEDADSGLLDGPYKGLNWSGVDNYNWVVSTAFGDTFGGMEARSGWKFAWSNGAVETVTISAAQFTLNSLWIRSGALNRTIIFTGLYGGQEKFSERVVATDSYQFLKLDFADIDTLRIDTAGVNFLFDEITINEAVLPVLPVLPVPEPVTAALFGLGLAGLALARRRA